MFAEIDPRLVILQSESHYRRQWEQRILATVAEIKLTWQAGKSQAGRWRKMHRGRILYYPGGSGRDDRHAYLRACWAYSQDSAALAAGSAPPCQGLGALDSWWRTCQDSDWARLQAHNSRAIDADLVRRIAARPDLEAAVRAERGEPAPETVEAAITAYLDRRRADVRSGQIVPSTLARIETDLKLVTEFRSGDTVDGINGAFCDSLRSWLLDQVPDRFSDQSAKSALVKIKTWINWLYETERIEALPRNFRRLSISAELTEPEPFTAAETQKIVACASPRNRCYLLLMLNCGMNGADVGALRDSEVDWEAGTITRHRTKTKRKAAKRKTPKVTYRLWRETMESLRQYRSGEDTVILSESGTVLVSQRLDKTGKVIVKDLVGQAIGRHFARQDLKSLINGRTPVSLRQTGASLLRDSEWADCDQFYLSHAPQSVRDKHYSAIPQRRFDDAIGWLGEQLGFTS